MTDEPEGQKKAGRETRDKWLPKMRVTQSELCAYKSKATAAGMTLSEFVRHSLENTVVHVREPLADVGFVVELNDISGQLSGIGNNINQLTHSGHIHGGLDLAQLDALQSEVQDARSIIKGLITALTDGS